MHAVQYKKSSIDFLLADTKAEELVLIEPKTFAKSSPNQKLRRLSRPNNPQFSLKILQQPIHAKVTPRPPSRVFPPFSEHRPIHPPPVLQLRLSDFNPEDDPLSTQLTDDYIDSITNKADPRSIERAQELRVLKQLKVNKVPSWAHYSTFFVIARLQGQGVDSKSETFEDVKPTEDLLVGSKVCSGMPLSLRTASPSNSYLSRSLPKEKQRSSNYAITFVFSDLAVTKTGVFRLKFDLFEVYKGKIQWRNMSYSDPFQVFTPKKFPGSSPSSPLTSFLFKHGARIRQRKRPFSKKDNNSDQEPNSPALPDFQPSNQFSSNFAGVQSQNDSTQSRSQYHQKRPRYSDASSFSSSGSLGFESPHHSNIFNQTPSSGTPSYQPTYLVQSVPHHVYYPQQQQQQQQGQQTQQQLFDQYRIVNSGYPNVIYQPQPRTYLNHQGLPVQVQLPPQPYQQQGQYQGVYHQGIDPHQQNSSHLPSLPSFNDLKTSSEKK